MAKILIFLSVLALYVISSPPTVTTGDAGEFITGACTLGISHPPGFPLYSLTGKLFSLLPLSNPAWRLNFASMLLSVLCSILLYAVVEKLVKSTLAALLAAFTYSLSAAAWSQSITAEAYSLNSFLIISSIFFAVLWRQKEEIKYFYLFSITFALSLCNHYPLALLAFPAYLPLLFPSGKLNPGSTLKSALIVLLTLLIYLYLPIRSSKQPLLNWGNPHDLTNFLNTILRKQYNTLELTQSINFSDKFQFLVNYFVGSLKQFHIMAIPAFIGLWAAFRKNRPMFYSLLTLIIFNGIILTLSLHFYFNPERVGIVNVYYLPSYMAIAIFSGFGIRYLQENIKSRNVKTAALSIIISVSLFAYARAFAVNFQRSNYIAFDYAKNILSFLPKNSILFIAEAGDESLFPVLYSQEVAGLRKDISVYDCFGNVFKNIYGDDFTLISDRARWKKRREGVENKLIADSKYPVYYLQISQDNSASEYSLKRRGLLELADNSRIKINSKDDFSLYNFRNIYGTTYDEYQDREIQGIYYYLIAKNFQTRNKETQALSSFNAAAKYSRDIAWINNNTGLEYLKLSKVDIAHEYFLRTVKDYPDYSSSWFNLGLTANLKNNRAGAIEYFEHYLSLNPFDPEAIKNTADLYWENGNRDKAVEVLNKTYPSLKPGLAQDYSFSAASFYKKKKYAQALIEWEKSLALIPDPMTYYNIGVAAIEVKNRTLSIYAFDRFMALSNDEKLKKSVKKYLNQISTN